ncbi:hypothetical protein L3X38_018118 [Prunus dulcis]|uniref:Uncharacterized protein n=1 Tax=Prunus dulcis TaxID=3755 RepID=A0AAD4W953_PRUDU|nr:hypothetical protein L3X38_018118 [Prunus dulcis]
MIASSEMLELHAGLKPLCSSTAGLIERFQSMRNAIFLLICWELDRIKICLAQSPQVFWSLHRSFSSGVWISTTSLALFFFLGGIGEDNGLIPSRVTILCRDFFLPVATNGLGCHKGQMDEIAPCA